MAVAACGAGEVDGPPTSSARTADVSATPSPSPTMNLKQLPERPEAMNEPTADGAIAAATYVLELYEYSFATGDLAPWRAITLDTCAYCTAVSDSVTAMFEAAERSSGSTVTVHDARAVELADDRWFSVEMQFTQGAATEYGAKGSVIGTSDARLYDAVFALSWADGWRVDHMGVELSGATPGADE